MFAFLLDMSERIVHFRRFLLFLLIPWILLFGWRLGDQASDLICICF